MPCQFQSIDFYTGNYLVQQGNKKGLYDTNGKEILPCNFDRIELYKGNYLVQQGNKKGLTTRTESKSCPANTRTSRCIVVNGRRDVAAKR